ncbi:MAG TPA: GYF domain-containing protein [Opitutaceae bacterium]|nr:GYF domain-containing protein [Opitutaceae bacterium]
MYTIIGGDGREYGPVSVEQVRSWVAGGRANLQTKARAAGSEEWQTIADFPELTGQGAAAALPFSGGAPKLDIISCYERSWALLKENFWPLVGVSVIESALLLGVMWVQSLVAYLPIITPLFAGALVGGWYYFFLLKIRGEAATLGDLFGGFTRGYGTLVATGLLVTTFTMVGLICLVLPGIYLIVAYSFAYILATDKRLSFWDSMETSRRTITSQWWRVLGLILLGIPFALLGLAALGVGLFVTLPLIVGAQAYAYEDLCNPRR